MLINNIRYVSQLSRVIPDSDDINGLLGVIEMNGLLYKNTKLFYVSAQSLLYNAETSNDSGVGAEECETKSRTDFDKESDKETTSTSTITQGSRRLGKAWP